MAKETDSRLEKWKQDMSGVSTDTPASHADHAWSDYESAKRNAEDVRAANPPGSGPQPPVGGLPGGYGPDPFPVQAADNRLFDTKIGLSAADTEGEWEQSAIERESLEARKSIAQAELVAAQQALEERQAAEQEAAWSPVHDMRARAQDARGRANAVLSEDMVRARASGEEITARRHLMDQTLLQDEGLARKRAEELQDSFDQAALDMDAVRVDPDRWEKATPALAQVFMALASSAFAFFSGGRGVNPVVALIDRAIDRDLKAQMRNADNKMKKINTGLEGAIVRDRLESTLTAAMHERAAQGLKFMVDNTREESARAMAQAAYMESVARVQDVHAERHEKYLTGMAKLQMDAREKAAKVEASKANIKWNDTKVAEQVQASTQGVRELNKIWSLYTNTLDTTGGKFGRIVGGIAGGEYSPFTTTEGVYNEQKGAMGITMAKASAGFQVSEPDRKAFETRLPGTKDTEEVAVRKMSALVEQTMSKLHETYRMASPADKARMEPEVQRAVIDTIKFIQSTPQVGAALTPETKAMFRKALGQ